MTVRLAGPGFESRFKRCALTWTGSDSSVVTEAESMERRQTESRVSAECGIWGQQPLSFWSIKCNGLALFSRAHNRTYAQCPHSSYVHSSANQYYFSTLKPTLIMPIIFSFNIVLATIYLFIYNPPWQSSLPAFHPSILGSSSGFWVLAAVLISFSLPLSSPSSPAFVSVSTWPASNTCPTPREPGSA